MGSDMVVALPPTTADGVALFGQNCTQPASQSVALVRERGRPHALGEMLSLSHLKLPQVRQTCTVLGLQAAGAWGFLGGVNEHHVAIGQTTMHTRLAATEPSLTGCELVRLALERCHCARQAVDCITDLVTRHGQGEKGSDHAFLIADSSEAFVVETAGAHWAVQHIAEVRAISEVCLLRQDWDRISRGLADVAIGREWWPHDGSKVDFAGVVAPDSGDHAAALRRWGQATLLLEQQSGRLDADYVRRILCDHSDSAVDAEALNVFAMERSLCRFPLHLDSPATAASLCVEMKAPEYPPLVWCAFGPPGLSVYFPIFLDGELPLAFQAAPPDGDCELWRLLMHLTRKHRDSERKVAVREALAALQARFDLQTKEMLSEAVVLKKQGDGDSMQRLLGSFMQANVERFEEFWAWQIEPRTEPAGAPLPAIAGMEEMSEVSSHF
jgi:secernin